MSKSAITKDQIKHVAKLANLELSKEEVATYTKQLADVIDYADMLSEVDTKNTEATYQTLDGTTSVYRSDKVRKSLSQSEALSGSDKTHGGYFVVDHVFGEKTTSKKKKISNRKKIDKYNAVLTRVDSSGTLGLKDIFMTKGVESTSGSRVLEGYTPPYSSTVVDLFKESGVKAKFKLNLDAWAHGSSGENSDFGPTTNPWDTNRVAGGSSSGSAVAVATEMVDVATGTDTGGSIRLPASFTNTVGLKPTYGAVSRYGIAAMASSFDSPGLFTRSVSELANYYRTISKVDKLDATSASKKRNSKKTFVAKKIGLPKEYFGKGVDSEIVSAVVEAVDRLKSKGCEIMEVSLPHTKYAIAVYYMIQTTEVASNLARYGGVRYGNDRTYFGQEAKRRIMLGTFVSSAGYVDKYYEQAAKVRTLIVKDFAQVFSQVDVLLAPVSPILPFKIGERVGDPLSMYLSDALTVTMNIAGVPSLALPCGFSNSGLPIGMQLIGPRWSEESLFDLGEKYQKLTDWHERRP